MTKIFVAHPYKSIPIDDYRAAFKDLERQFKGVKFVYADEEITSDYILEKIERMILEADFSLFDVTTWNPNVALELGLAHGLKRQIYILFNPTVDATEVPSDIRGKERIQYNSLSELKSKMALVLQKHLPKDSTTITTEYDTIKANILDYVGKNDQVGSARIADALSLNQGVLRSILYELKDSGALKTYGAKRGMKYGLVQGTGGQ
jgi:predicted nucleotide-binding protein